MARRRSTPEGKHGQRQEIRIERTPEEMARLKAERRAKQEEAEAERRRQKQIEERDNRKRAGRVTEVLQADHPVNFDAKLWALEDDLDELTSEQIVAIDAKVSGFGLQKKDLISRESKTVLEFIQRRAELMRQKQARREATKARSFSRAEMLAQLSEEEQEYLKQKNEGNAAADAGSERPKRGGFLSGLKKFFGGK